MSELFGRDMHYTNPLDHINGQLGNDLARSIKANAELAERILPLIEKKKMLDNQELQDDIVKVLHGLINVARPVVRHGLEILAIEERREDHWDVLKEKCESDPMFKEQWDELMILLRLEED